MKRLHVHIAVRDLPESIQFYTALFGTAPSVLKENYAKWRLEDPCVNFAISARGTEPGIDHLGIQVESGEELQRITLRLADAGQPPIEQPQTTCCYARSDKAWTSDPEGIAWEVFMTHGGNPFYGESSMNPGNLPQVDTPARSCCAPRCAALS
jgi:catechol 2,3-dioxygenase-like lactoylglutathione lyase family enzyme